MKSITYLFIVLQLNSERLQEVEALRGLRTLISMAWCSLLRRSWKEEKPSPGEVSGCYSRPWESIYKTFPSQFVI